VIADLVAAVPDVWLDPVPGAQTPEELRSAYATFLRARRDSRAWLPGAAS